MSIATVAGLEVRSAVVRYGDTVAVNDVSLTVGPDEIVVLLGPSGCGKSTLLRAVAGLEPLTAGQISFDGRNLAGTALHRRRFGLMFQDGVLFPQRTVAGNIAYGLSMTGVTRAAQRARVAELLELVGLAGYGDRSVATLSGGQAQRVALARALAPEPRLLLLDEPLAALDAALREQLLMDLRTILTATGTPTIFVTHDQDEAFAIGSRVAVMRDGELVQAGTPAEVWRAPVDVWTARFVGYPCVLGPLDAAVLAARVDRPELAGRTVALRPGAFVADPAGEVTAEVVAAVPGPDRTRLELRVPGIGVLPGIASGKVPAVGQIRLRFDPNGCAVLPDRPAAGSHPAGDGLPAGRSPAPA